MSKFMESIAADVDDEELRSLQKTSKDGIYKNDILLFIRAEDAGKKLKIGSYLDVNSKRLFVHDVTETAGVYKLVLGRNQV